MKVPKKHNPYLAPLIEAAIYLIPILLLTLSNFRVSRTLSAAMKNPKYVLPAIGLFPLLIVWQVRRRKLRYTLADLSAAFLGFGATLIPLDYLSQKFNYPLREYLVIVLYVEIMIGFGFLSALKNRNLLQERAVALRWLIFAAFLMAPATALPALYATIELVINNELFHNDWTGMLAWLALILPVLISVWFRTIFNVSKVDAEGAPRE